jgi:hypothetical protein
VLVVTLAPLLLGAWILRAGVRNLRRAARLRGAGVAAPGRVVRLRRRTLNGGRLVHHPVVEWTTAEGREMEQGTRVGRQLAERSAFQRGAEVLVRYDPRDPTLMDFDGYRDGYGDVASWTMCGAGGALSVSTLLQVALGG